MHSDCVGVGRSGGQYGPYTQVGFYLQTPESLTRSLKDWTSTAITRKSSSTYVCMERM